MMQTFKDFATLGRLYYDAEVRAARCNESATGRHAILLLRRGAPWWPLRLSCTTPRRLPSVADFVPCLHQKANFKCFHLVLALVGEPFHLPCIQMACRARSVWYKRDMPVLYG